MNSNKLAFIGGSGIYKLDILNEIIEHDLISSFGKPSSKILEGKINGNSIFFISRHGKDHRLAPSEINYRANIECLKQLGITDIISLSAVGSLKAAAASAITPLPDAGCEAKFKPPWIKNCDNGSTAVLGYSAATLASLSLADPTA